MSWASSNKHGGNYGSNSWSNKNWGNWRKSQDWTPGGTRTRAQAKQQSLDDEVSKIQAGMNSNFRDTSSSVVEGMPMGNGIRSLAQDLNMAATHRLAPSQRFDGSEEAQRMRKKTAVRLKAVVKLRASLDDPHSSLAVSLDEEIAECRALTRGAMAPDKSLD